MDDENRLGVLLNYTIGINKRRGQVMAHLPESREQIVLLPSTIATAATIHVAQPVVADSSVPNRSGHQLTLNLLRDVGRMPIAVVFIVRDLADTDRVPLVVSSAFTELAHPAYITTSSTRHFGGPLTYQTICGTAFGFTVGPVMDGGHLVGLRSCDGHAGAPYFRANAADVFTRNAFVVALAGGVCPVSECFQRRQQFVALILNRAHLARQFQSGRVLYGCHVNLLLNQRLVGQSLIGHAVDEAVQPVKRGPRHVAVIQTERELIDIAAGVLWRDVVVDADDAALQHGKGALHAVRGDCLCGGTAGRRG
jgi:hypothetical protein